VGGSQYSRVCGRARAYRWGLNWGFYGYHSRHQGINGFYVDGMFLTRGALVHICMSGHLLVACSQQWLFSFSITPHLLLWAMIISVRMLPHQVIAWDNNGFHFYPNDVLWDGQVCKSGGRWCQFNNPPWFTKNLINIILPQIELSYNSV